MINITNFSLQYPNFSLTIPHLSFTKNGLYLLSGNNGTGKTSLLRSIAGLNREFKGTISINNQSINSLSNQEIIFQLSFLPQISTALPPIKGKDFIKQGLYLGGEDQSLFLIQNLSAQDLLEKKCHTMSGGEKQLLSFIRNLSIKKKIILLDEPDTFLSKSNKLNLAKIIQDLSKETIIILSSHQSEIYNPTQILSFKEITDYTFEIISE